MRSPGLKFCFQLGQLVPRYTEVAAAAPYEPVLVKENFPCSVYTCRLGVVPTNHSTLTVYTDSSGETWARLKCFLFLDDFEEYGGEHWHCRPM
jgi:hypothetical protein